MKKTICAALAALLALSMAGCGTGSSKEETTLSTVETTTGATTPSTEAPTEAPVEDVFEEIVLADNENLTFKITGVENDPIWGYTLKVFLENKTGQDLMFSLNDVSVNGFMCDPYWAHEVAAGKKSNTTISWLESDFAENGIETVDEISFTLRVYDSNDWMADDILNKTFTVNP